MDMAGVPQDVCLHLALQIFDLLPTIPTNLSFCAPIPMMLTYGPESYTSYPWLEDGGETFFSRQEGQGLMFLDKEA